MKKSIKIVIAVIAIILVVAVIAVITMKLNKEEEISSNLGQINSSQDLENIMNKIYEEVEAELPEMQPTLSIDVTDDSMVQTFTGLENGNDLEYLVVSEPWINVQAYSFVLAKVKDGVDANKVAKDMNENIDSRKWICVSAERVYSVNSEDVVCLVMASEEMGKPVFDKFKSIAGNVGQEYVKEEAEDDFELPPEVLM